MGLIQDARSATTLLSNALKGRLRRNELARKLAQHPLPEHNFKVGVYFADGEVNLYQVRQWYKPLEELAKTWPVVILSRNTLGCAPGWEG